MGNLFIRPSVVDVPLSDRVVVITGCDSGFGHLSAVALDGKGYKVIAGCLREQSVKELQAKLSSRSRAVLWDVTKTGDTTRVAAEVTRDYPNGIYALINNAGIAYAAPIEFQTTDHFRRTMDVNFFGMVDVTKTFLPSLRQQTGRVINVTSVAGRSAVPQMSSYSASKFAAEAFSDALRREMWAFGIKVIVIEPSFMKTPLLEPLLVDRERMIDAAPRVLQDTYGTDYRTKSHEALKRLLSQSMDPDVVVQKIVEAVESSAPKTRYLIGAQTLFLGVIINLLPDAVADYILRVATNPGLKILPSKHRLPLRR